MQEPITRLRITETWLSKRPSSHGFLVSGLMTFLLAVMSFLFWNNLTEASLWMPASKLAVIQNHELWRLFSSLAAHADEKHLLSNSLIFFVLGGFLNSYFGSVLLPFLAIAFGALVNLLVLRTMPDNTHLIGASGIVFWMGGAWITLYYLLDIKRNRRQRILRSLGVALVLFFPAQAFDPQISYLSHLLGFLFGVLAGFLVYFLNRHTFLAAVRSEVQHDEWIDHEHPHELRSH